MFCRFLGLCLLLLFYPTSAWAWGALEHSSITGAAIALLSPAALAFLGAEARRLTKAYCNIPDINNAAYYGVCAQNDQGKVRVPDLRRDLNAPYYCDHNSITGTGVYFGHGPAIAFADAKLPLPDEHSTEMFENKHFCESAVYKFLSKSQTAFTQNHYFDAIRFLGVAAHYLQDCTPPPHALLVSNNPQLHHDMEAIADHNQINVSGYQPRLLDSTPSVAIAAAEQLAQDIASEARCLAEEILGLIHSGKQAAAALKTIRAAHLAVCATADIMHTMLELNQNNLPRLIPARPGVNLLYNPSFDLDEDGDLHPDGWVHEWHDLACPYDMHVWDRISTRGRGACVRLYRVCPAGAVWRTARSHGIPVIPGQKYELTGMVRPQNAGERNYIALRFQNADYETLAEFCSPLLGGNAAWQRVKAVGTAPVSAVDALAVCASFDNPGSVLFDDLRLTLS